MTIKAINIKTRRYQDTTVFEFNVEKDGLVVSYPLAEGSEEPPTPKVFAIQIQDGRDLDKEFKAYCAKVKAELLAGDQEPQARPDVVL